MDFATSLFDSFTETINGKEYTFSILNMEDIFNASKDIRTRECNKIDIDLKDLSEVQRYKVKSNIEISFDYTIDYLLTTFHGNLLALHYSLAKKHPEILESKEIFDFNPFILSDLAKRVINVPTIPTIEQESPPADIDTKKVSVNGELEPADNKKK